MFRHKRLNYVKLSWSGGENLTLFNLRPGCGSLCTGCLISIFYNSSGRGCFLRPRVGSNVLSECEDFGEPEGGAECRYSCPEGFTLNGASSLRCENNRWRGQVPTCASKLKARKMCSSQTSNSYICRIKSIKS